MRADAPGTGSAAARPRILVILPRGQGYYVIRELYRVVPGFDVVYASEDDEFGTQFHAPVSVLPIRFVGPPRFLGGLSTALSRIDGLDPLLEKVRPAVVVTFELFTRVTDQVARACTRFGYVHLVEVHETTNRNYGLWACFPWTRLLASRNATRVDLVLAGSRRTETMLTSLGIPARKLLLMRPGVFAEDFPDISSEGGLGPVTLLYLGALRRNKGLPTLIAALDSLWPSDYRAGQLVIAGSGPLSGWVKRQAASRGWLRFDGRVDEARKVELLSRASLFVYPSEDIRLLGLVRWEEQGALSVVEAMMSGLPVVCSDSGALPEIVPKGNRLFKQGSREELTSALGLALNDRESGREVGTRNRARAKLEFDLNRNGVTLGKALSLLLRQG